MFTKQLQELQRITRKATMLGEGTPGAGDMAGSVSAYLGDTLGVAVPPQAVEDYRADLRQGVLAADGSGRINIAMRRISLLSCCRWPRSTRIRKRPYVAGLNRDVFSAVLELKQVRDDVAGARNEVTWEEVARRCDTFGGPPAYGCLKKLWNGFGQYVVKHLSGDELDEFINAVMRYSCTTRELSVTISNALGRNFLLKYLLGEYDPTSMATVQLPAGLQQFAKGLYRKHFLLQLEASYRSITAVGKWLETLEADVMSTVMDALYVVAPELLLN
jgi:hypothetical protein